MTDRRYEQFGEVHAVHISDVQHQPMVEPYTVQYVLTLLVNIFCFCLPCSVIGTIHLLAARADAVRGLTYLAQKKKCQAIAWTAAGFAIGCVGLVIYIILMATLISQASSIHVRYSG